MSVIIYVNICNQNEMEEIFLSIGTCNYLILEFAGQTLYIIKALST